jgi:hypothetical protein
MNLLPGRNPGLLSKAVVTDQRRHAVRKIPTDESGFDILQEYRLELGKATLSSRGSKFRLRHYRLVQPDQIKRA